MQRDDSTNISLVDNATAFHKSLRELRDFSSQLYQAADYCETTFLSAEDKRNVMENTKQYVSRAVVAAVDHLGSISANLESCLSKSSSIPETEHKIDILKLVSNLFITSTAASKASVSSSFYNVLCRKKVLDFQRNIMDFFMCQQRMVTCQQRSHKLALEKFYMSPDFRTHHCRYILPPLMDSAAMDAVSRDAQGGIASKREKDEQFETEEPLFLRTYNCKPSLVENSVRDAEKKNGLSPPVLPVRGDGASISPKSEQSIFQFEEARKLKCSMINWKQLQNKEIASLIRRGKRILA